MSHAEDVAAKQAAFLKAAEELEEAETASAAPEQKPTAVAISVVPKIRTLDRLRPYGTMQPPTGINRFQQDGVFFDHLGREVVNVGE